MRLYQPASDDERERSYRVARPEATGCKFGPGILSTRLRPKILKIVPRWLEFPLRFSVQRVRKQFQGITHKLPKLIFRRMKRMFSNQRSLIPGVLMFVGFVVVSVANAQSPQCYDLASLQGSYGVIGNYGANVAMSQAVQVS